MQRYAIAVGVVLVTVLLKAVLGLSAEHPFVLFPGAVAVAAWYGGRGPGALAALLVALVSLYGVLPVPLGSAREAAQPADLVGLAALVAEGALVVVLTAGLRSARTRAEVASAASAVAHREAEFALAVRDEMLLLWTTQLRGPMADLEALARSVLSDLEREGRSDAATETLRTLVEDAALVGRATAGWDKDARTSGSGR